MQEGMLMIVCGGLRLSCHETRKTPKEIRLGKDPFGLSPSPLSTQRAPLGREVLALCVYVADEVFAATSAAASVAVVAQKNGRRRMLPCNLLNPRACQARAPMGRGTHLLIIPPRCRPTGRAMLLEAERKVSPTPVLLGENEGGIIYDMPRQSFRASEKL